MASKLPQVKYGAAYTKAVRTGVLNLQQKEIDALPEGIFNMHQFVPENNGWWELVVPHTINLAHNNITNLLPPKDFNWVTAWKELKTLNVSYNRISHIPNEILHLEFVRYFVFHHNNLTNIASFGASSHNLIRIEVQHNNLKSLCDDIGKCINLQHLNISHNKLSSLPKSLSKCVKLQTFEAINNSISGDLNHIDFSECIQLREFDVSNNKITSIHSSLLYLPLLYRLSLRQNKINNIDVPDSRRESRLIELYLSHNNLRSFPFNALTLSSLKLLDLKGNKFDKISKDISECCVCLERLDISDNMLEDLPSELALIQNIKSVIVSGNPLRRLSIHKYDSKSVINYLRKRIQKPNVALEDAITKLNINMNDEELKELKLNKQNLVLLPSNICKMVNLSHLEMDDNKLKDINDLKYCKGLQYLSARKNNISDITVLFELNKLEIIDVSTNKINAINVSDSNDASGIIWPKLHTLRLGYNQITDVSPLLQCMGGNISVLDIGNNNISVFPDCILQWKALQMLDLSNNNLSNIPNELGLMETLNGLLLFGNRLRKMQSVINHGNTHKILQWLRNRIS